MGQPLYSNAVCGLDVKNRPCDDDVMRTTVTLEPDVAQKLKRRMAEKKLTLKEALNQALRAGLEVEERRPKVPFKVKAHSFGFRPDIDPNKMNQLADDLEDEDLLAKLRR